MKKFTAFLFIYCLCFLYFLDGYSQSVLIENAGPGAFSFINEGIAGKILVQADEDTLIKKAAALLQQDIEMVTGLKPEIVPTPSGKDDNYIIIGSAAKSRWIREMNIHKKINLIKLRDRWEAYQIESIEMALPGVKNALVITGSDKRGTAFGVFEFSRQIGVSPWYWWADVPIKKKDNLYIKKGYRLMDFPRVKYRGIFINDEAPALSGWSKEQFGGFNHRFYEKVFELMLRLKSDYIWPAMWGNAFYDDDSLNIKIAEIYGIVIGTTHHEPLMRAHDEWRRYGKGKWDYTVNEAQLKDFWRKGMRRAGNEKIVSLGMRGDGDEPMTDETATTLLERIVKDQRNIIEEVTGQSAVKTPQLWALYKEVQDYYDKGMRVPDDVTLLLCDDNWGNIRKLPRLSEKPRKGGYGIYYHFDYVGGPRNYKWLNTNPISRVWEQMNLAWQYNAKDIWIVNVGDIKPMEFPISFFLDFAWNPDKIGADDLQRYTEQWSSSQFGQTHAAEIASIISSYTKYNGRRKPELLDAYTYSLHHYEEAENVSRSYKELLQKAEKINEMLAPEYRDAYFQLVLHPIKACANLQEMYLWVAKNHDGFKRKDKLTNTYSDKARECYMKDSLITLQYHTLGNGKWNHLMSQTHIGYTYWQQPPVNKIPELMYLPDDSSINSSLSPLKTKPVTAAVPSDAPENSYYESDRVVSIEASHFSSAIEKKGIRWQILPDHGRTGDAVTSFPVTKGIKKWSPTGPRLQYEFYTYSSGPFDIESYFSPTLNFHNTEGLRFAIAVDNEPPQIISINKEDKDLNTWEQWVSNNIIIKKTNHAISRLGKHTVKYWVIDPAVVLQKLVIDFGGKKPSYLGPPETRVP